METQLDRSFMACAAAVLVHLAAPLAGYEWPHPWALVLLLAPPVLLLGAYVWFAISVGRAEKAVGDNATIFVFWVLAVPLLSLVPIPVVSTVLIASPLSLKFLLSRELRSKVHDQTFAG